MNLSLSNILAGFVFGVYGFYLIKWGRQRAQFSWILIGIALMTYSYFIPNDILVWVVGAALLGLAYLLRFS